MAEADLLGGGLSFPQGLPELSEAMDDRALHLTASRSNNCKSHLSESWACEWSVSTGSFKATAYITRTENSTFSQASAVYACYIIDFFCAGIK